MSEQRHTDHRPPDHRPLRDAFGCFATGVTIVTSFDIDGNPVGFTANSFTSVSLDPPLLLVCPGKNIRSLPVIQKAGLFGVSVLSSGQRSVADCFASKREDRFCEGEWVESESGVLLLEGACANFACTLVNDIDAGDHQLLIGQIDSFRSAESRNPLMYLRGSYV